MLKRTQNRTEVEKHILKLALDIADIKGFFHPAEGRALYGAALEAGRLGPCLEIGSYCGKSTVYYGTACRERNTVLFAVDHHRGSEENQPGEQYHDPDLMDPRTGRLDSLPWLRRTLHAAGLEGTVIPVVGASALVARHWSTPLAMVFIDGGHSMAAAMDDYALWTPHLMPGGMLALHDVFPDPADGGRPPYEIYSLALASGRFAEVGAVRSLRLLRRLPSA